LLVGGDFAAAEVDHENHEALVALPTPVPAGRSGASSGAMTAVSA
jgi:hypothetical protein